MDKTMSVRVGQLNLQRSAAATTELPVTAASLKLDAVLVQEQYNHAQIIDEVVSSKDGFERLRALAHEHHRKRKELEL